MHYYLGISSAISADIAHSFALIREDGKTLYLSMKDYFEQSDVLVGRDPEQCKLLNLEYVDKEGLQIHPSVRYAVILRRNIQKRIKEFFVDDAAITVHSRLLTDYLRFCRVSKYMYDFCLEYIPVTFQSHPQVFNLPEHNKLGAIGTQDKYRPPVRNAYWRAYMLKTALTGE